jgi:hypothetical protein
VCAGKKEQFPSLHLKFQKDFLNSLFINIHITSIFDNEHRPPHYSLSNQPTFNPLQLHPQYLQVNRASNMIFTALGFYSSNNVSWTSNCHTWKGFQFFVLKNSRIPPIHMRFPGVPVLITAELKLPSDQYTRESTKLF